VLFVLLVSECSMEDILLIISNFRVLKKALTLVSTFVCVLVVRFVLPCF